MSNLHVPPLSTTQRIVGIIESVSGAATNLAQTFRSHTPQIDSAPLSAARHRRQKDVRSRLAAGNCFLSPQIIVEFSGRQMKYVRHHSFSSCAQSVHATFEGGLTMSSTRLTAITAEERMP